MLTFVLVYPNLLEGYILWLCDNAGLPDQRLMTHEDKAGQVTQLLRELTAGNQSVVDAIMPLVYSELRQLASLKLKSDQLSDSICPTILVHEAYLRLVGQEKVNWQSRAHFFRAAARAMRRILIDHARQHSSAKRGGGRTMLTLAEDLVGDSAGQIEVLVLDEALSRLGAIDKRMAQVVEFHVFAGMTIAEAAFVLNVSKRTVEKDWWMAKLWLRRELSAGSGQ